MDKTQSLPTQNLSLNTVCLLTLLTDGRWNGISTNSKPATSQTSQSCEDSVLKGHEFMPLLLHADRRCDSSQSTQQG